MTNILCPVCTRENPMGPIAAAGARESLCCKGCGATSRNRAVAFALSHEFFRMAQGGDFHWSSAQIYQVGLSAVTNSLRQWGHVTVSEFAPRENCCVQNLEALTFADQAFDLVVCSDVLEHVRLYRKALSEIARVLRPGGALILTVPLSGGPGHTEYCAVLDPLDTARDIWDPAAPVHADPLDPAGCKVYRTYHAETLIHELAELGLSASLTEKDLPEFGIVNAAVFVCRKS